MRFDITERKSIPNTDCHPNNFFITKKVYEISEKDLKRLENDFLKKVNADGWQYITAELENFYFQNPIFREEITPTKLRKITKKDITFIVNWYRNYTTDKLRRNPDPSSEFIAKENYELIEEKSSDWHETYVYTNTESLFVIFFKYLTTNLERYNCRFIHEITWYEGLIYSLTDFYNQDDFLDGFELDPYTFNGAWYLKDNAFELLKKGQEIRIAHIHKEIASCEERKRKLKQEIKKVLSDGKNF